ncbi:hypothetical protein KIN20_036558 [Parelaphostrongylus tenuis]|uniref:Uncharacterized protein n=1 Tax=Parelaphostrongylus tenuis TaxID=148309 RepID=A0AAD5RDB6_PARTN|nr:hypothetical protein KIN20_036558 [Parelaphostrongylus tenuis]
MDLYCNLVRNARDQMYALEVESDILNDELQSEILVAKLLDKMLTRHNGIFCPSIIRNVCEILITLLCTNHMLFRPSHTLYREFNGESTAWLGGNPSSVPDRTVNDVLNENRAAVRTPDRERVVEKVVVSRVSELLDLVIDELERDIDHMDETWSYLLRVVVELCDTNHMETHVVLDEQLRKCATARLFSLVWRHPRSSILHSLLERIVSLILYTSMESQSPLISYLFKTLDLPSLARFGIQPRCVLSKIDLQSLRTYHIHLVLAVEQAQRNSPNSQGLQELVQECPFWSELAAVVEEWLSWNMPDPEVMIARSTNQHPCVGDVLDDFETQALPPHHNALLEFNNETVSSPMTDVFDTALGELQVSSETKEFSPQTIRVCKVEVNLEENDVDESSFEAVCTMKECAILDDWPMQDGDQSYDWPGAFSEKQRDGLTSFQAQWNQQQAKSNGAEMNDWPCSPQDTSNPKKDVDNDDWADFSSLRSENCLASDGYSDWPGVEDKKGSTSPGTKEMDISDSPVLTGLAAAVANSSLEKCALNESDC